MLPLVRVLVLQSTLDSCGELYWDALKCQHIHDPVRSCNNARAHGFDMRAIPVANTSEFTYSGVHTVAQPYSCSHHYSNFDLHSITESL